jgi:dimethylamine corrinoid protein
MNMKKAMPGIYKELADSVVTLNEDKVVSLSQEVLEQKLDANQAITCGLIRGMEIVGRKYENDEYFIPELLIGSDVMNAGLRILEPYIKDHEPAGKLPNVKAVIGVMEGDTHVIGKNLVKIMLENAGFQMVDLGPDVPIRQFMERAVKEEAGMICMSSLMSTSLLAMKDVMGLLEKEGVRDRFKVLVGGASVSAAYARSIGADGFAPNAVAAARVAKKLMKQKNNN